mgnify:CR=1 FL=1
MSKILFVEDNEKIIMGIEFLFQQEGFSFAIVRKKKEALVGYTFPGTRSILTFPHTNS